MSSTVSRRVIYVKTKGRRQPKKPERPTHDDGTMVGEAARASTPLLGPRPAIDSPKPLPTWMLVGAWAGGLLLVAGLIALLNGLAAGRPSAPEESPRSARAIGTSPSSRHLPSGGSVQSGKDFNPNASVEGFLNAPFPKRRVPTKCEVRAEGDIAAAIGKCVEASRQLDE